MSFYVPNALPLLESTNSKNAADRETKSGLRGGFGIAEMVTFPCCMRDGRHCPFWKEKASQGVRPAPLAVESGPLLQRQVLQPSSRPYCFKTECIFQLTHVGFEAKHYVSSHNRSGRSRSGPTTVHLGCAACVSSQVALDGQCRGFEEMRLAIVCIG